MLFMIRFLDTISDNLHKKTSPTTDKHTPPFLTAQAWTSVSSEQSFQRHHWNTTGCWVSCDCGGNVPMPGRRPGCSSHCQGTSWFTNKDEHAAAVSVHRYMKIVFEEQNVPFVGIPLTRHPLLLTFPQRATQKCMQILKSFLPEEGKKT